MSTAVSEPSLFSVAPVETQTTAGATWRAIAATVIQCVQRGARSARRNAARIANHVDRDARRHVAELPLLALASIGPRSRAIAALPDDGHNPILCVHGLAAHPGTFVLLRGFLDISGRSRSYTVDVNEGTMQERADTVRAAVAQILAVNQLPPDAKVDIIAHSMGGLVSRTALCDEATRERVGSLITLGSPHEGTVLARFIGEGATSGIELRRDSSTVQRLAAQVPWQPSWPRLVSLWSPNDILLMPQTCAVVEGARNVECVEFTHFTWLLHPRGWRQVLAALHEA